MTASDNRYNIRSVERALSVLSLLSDGKQRTLKKLSEEIGMSNSTIFRFLTTLSNQGFVERDGQTAMYRLGIACLELARAYHESSDVRQVAFEELERLRDDTKETVHLAVLDKMEVVYVEKFLGLHAIGIMTSQVGGRSPAYCTGLGKVLLAFQDPDEVRTHFKEKGFHRFTENTILSINKLMDHLETVRAQGYALDCGEHEREVRCIAAPIYNVTGKVVAAISISGPVSRMGPVENQTELIRETQKTSRTISLRLGYTRKNVTKVR
jgi:DNA-binding IclR family transcriptional regulator